MAKKVVTLSMRDRLHQLINGDDPRFGRSFDVFITFVIVLSIVALSIETIPDLPTWGRKFLKVAEVVIVSIFTVEYVVRILGSRPPSKYVFSFWGCLDALSIAPFYLAFLGLGGDLRAIRVLRLLRVLRVFKLFRHAQAADRLKSAFVSVKDELSVFAGLSSMLLFVSAVGIYFFENEVQPEAFSSIPESLWWALVTLTTVGYGDVYPVTFGGRVLTSVVLVIGLGIVAVPTGLIASALTKMHDGGNDNK